MSTLIDSYSESNQSFFSTVGNNSNGFQSSYGQSFTGDGGTLEYISLYLRDWGSPTGTATVYVYAHSGTYGTSSIPTGEPLAVSDDFDASAVGSSFALHDFTFSGDNKIVLEDGVYYVFAMRFPADIGNNAISMGVDNNSPAHSGNLSYEYNSGTLWGADGSRDVCFYVYGEVPVTPTVGTKYPLPAFKR